MKHFLFLFLLLPSLALAQVINISATDTTICAGTNVTFTSTSSGYTNPHFQWLINYINTGSDSFSYTTNTLMNGDTVSCLLENSARDSIIAISNFLVMNVQHFPNVGVITGIDSTVCIGVTITLTDTITGGVWGASNIHASDSLGYITGQPDIYASCQYSSKDTIYYIISNFLRG